MVQRIAVFRTPSGAASAEPSRNYATGMSSLLPLDLAAITSPLRSEGCVVLQEDLNIRFIQQKEIFAADRLNDPLTVNNIDCIFEAGKHRELDILFEEEFADIGFDGQYDLVLLLPVYCREPVTLRLLLITAAYLKRKYPGLPVAIGGMLFDKMIINPWAFTLTFSRERGLFDYLMLNCSGRSVQQLARFLSQEISFSEVAGLCFFNGQEYVSVESRKCAYLGPVDFSGLPIEYYRIRCPGLFLAESKEARQVLLAPYSLAESCPRNCAYCSMSESSNNLLKAPVTVVNEIVGLRQRLNVDFIYFVQDACLNSDAFFVEGFLLEMERQQPDIFFSAALGFWDLDEDKLKRLYAVGCRCLVFGLETGSQRLLDFARKDVDITRAAEGIRYAHGLGIFISVNMICGLPSETEDDVIASVDFLHSNKKYIDEVTVYPFRLSANSPFFKKPQEFGITNINFVHSVKNMKMAADLDNIWPRRLPVLYGFDEAGGLEWPEKSKLIDRSLVRVETAFKRVGLPDDLKLAYLCCLNRVVKAPGRLKCSYRWLALQYSLKKRIYRLVAGLFSYWRKIILSFR